MESYEIRAAEGEVKKAQENIWLLAAQIFQKLTLNLVSIREVLIRRVQSKSYEIRLQKANCWELESRRWDRKVDSKSINQWHQRRKFKKTMTIN